MDVGKVYILFSGILSVVIGVLVRYIYLFNLILYVDDYVVVKEMIIMFICSLDKMIYEIIKNNVWNNKEISNCCGVVFFGGEFSIFVRLCYGFVLFLWFRVWLDMDYYDCWDCDIIFWVFLWFFRKEKSVF